MMPSFARGWEKDGWERIPGMGVSKGVGSPSGEVFLTCFVYDNGDLMIARGITTITLPYGDPQTAKERAEALMEGL